MEMKSKVSGYLQAALAPEIVEGITKPMLERTFNGAFPLMSRINKAHVLMLEKQGIIGRDVAVALMREVVRLENEGPGSVELDYSREDAYFNYEAEIIRRLGHDVGGCMHTARSRNDLKATQDRMRARDVALVLQDRLLALRKALLAQGERYRDHVMTGYTHSQPAQQVTFGWYLLGLEQAFQRDMARLLDNYGRLNQCPLGAAALAGTSFAIDREYTAGLLGFDKVVPHALDAIASRETIIELLAAGCFAAMTMGRLMQDFHTWTSYENPQIRLPDRVAITSSIMPQKKNMGALESLRGRPATITGALMTALMAYKGLPYGHNQDGPFESLRWAFDALEELALALPVVTLLVNEAIPNTDFMVEQARENFCTTTDLADLLVSREGLSFRDAHHVVGRVVSLAISADVKAQHVGADLLRQAAVEMLGREISLSDEEVRAAMSPEHCVAARRSGGTPSAADVSQLLALARAQLDADAGQLKHNRESLDQATRLMDAQVAGLLT